MKIYNSGGTQLLDVAVEDSSARYRVIMGDHNLTLKFSRATHIELPVGSYCVFEGITYTLKRPENLKMIHTRDFEYTVLLESPQADTKIWKFRNTVDGRLKFPMTATPLEHLTMLVANLNRRGSGWTVGDCITGVERLINYDHDYCWDALGKMADTFKTEFEIDNKRVSLKKLEYNKDAPLALSYGKGNGFRSGITRQSEGNSPVEFLFVQGGSRNIDRSKYGSSVLLLPKNQTLTYEGRTYRVDDKGLSIFRTDKSPSTYAEDSLSLEDIYPSRVGTVSEVIVVDSGKHFYDFTDASLGNESLNFNDYLIAGEKMTVEFQTGQLAGHGEFEVKYIHAAIGTVGSDSYRKPYRFEIVPKEEDGYTMPDATFKPAAGDKYIVLNISLPDAYIRDDNNQSGASWDMFREAVRYMYDHEDNEFSFKGELDPLWAKSDWVNIGGKIVLGGFVSFTDARFQATAVKVRITAIKDFVNRPHKPEIELSNKPVSPSFLTEIKQLEGNEVETVERHRDALSFTKRRFRDAQETMSMLSDLLDAGFDNFTNNINPIAIQTMQLLVGDESLQYRFVDDKVTPATVPHNVTYNQTTKILTAPAGILQHMSLGIDTLSSSHQPSEYKFWDISAYTSAALTVASKKYYLYVRVSRTGTTGTFLLRESPINMNYGSTYYYLLYGILNSEYEGERSFVTLYGFTEVLPGRVTTDRVISGDGQSYFDMLNNAMRLGNSASEWGLDFNSNGDGKLRLRGTLVQSGSGDEQPLGCFRGWWDASYVYYYGDEVLYLTGGQTVTYRQIYTESSGGVITYPPIQGADKAPTNTTYWQVVAQGVKGDFPSTCFIRLPSAITPSSAPTGGTYDSPIPTSTYTHNGTTYSWSDGIPSGEYQLWATTRTFKGDGSASSWSVPRKMTDTDTYDVEFAKKQAGDATPAAPSASNRHGGSGTQIWFDPVDDSSEDFTQMYWRAEREKKNGEWGDWTIVRIKGERGDTGQSSFPSTMFVRMNSTPTKPANDKGSFSDPSPSGCLAGQNSSGTNVYWSDGIPSGENKLWATSRVFTSDGQSPQEASWSTPRQMTDTSTYDVEFAKKQTNDAVPATPTTANRHGGSGTQIWFDPVDDSSEDFTQMYWRAERQKVNGVWTSWVIVRIKGEQGDPGINGDYYEYRYCVNGSPNSAPSLNNWNRDPSVTGATWSTTYPSSIGALQYLWMTTALINGASGALKSQWSSPIRQTPVDALMLGENLINNSEAKETYSVESSGNNGGADGQFILTGKVIADPITLGATISGQVRITLSGVNPKSGGGGVLVYMNGSLAWPTIAEKTGITSNNVTLDLKHENFAYDNNGGTMVNTVYIRLNNFNAGGTISIERVKVEYGTGCTAWCLSEDDKVGPATPFRGVYSSSKEYVGTLIRCDVVKYNSHFYVARTDAGSFSNKTPTNTDYWNDFGAEFESIATNLLLAELANIAGFIFRNSRLESQKLADGTTTDGATSSLPMIYLNGLTGAASLAGGKALFNSDGSVSLASGKIAIDTSGNVTGQNVTFNSGTFKGLLNATQGLILPVSTSSSQNDYSMSGGDSIHINNYNKSGNYSEKREAVTTVYLPTTANTGQQVIVRFNGNTGHKKISGNGKTIDGSSQLWFYGSYNEEWYDGEGGSSGGGDYEPAYNFSVTLIYNGTNWNLITQTCPTVSPSQKTLS